MVESRELLTRFQQSCARAWIVYEQYQKLYEHSETRRQLLNAVATYFFHDLQDTLIDYILLQVSKLTDPATLGSNAKGS